MPTALNRGGLCESFWGNWKREAVSSSSETMKFNSATLSEVTSGKFCISAQHSSCDWMPSNDVRMSELSKKLSTLNNNSAHLMKSKTLWRRLSNLVMNRKTDTVRLGFNSCSNWITRENNFVAIPSRQLLRANKTAPGSITTTKKNGRHKTCQAETGSFVFSLFARLLSAASELQPPIGRSKWIPAWSSFMLRERENHKTRLFGSEENGVKVFHARRRENRTKVSAETRHTVLKKFMHSHFN